MTADNSNLIAKAALRNYFLDKLPRPATVLECFAGEQRRLYNACYARENVTSLDIKSVNGVLKCDNRKFIASHDLTPFNYFDLDAYGSPYELMLNIFHRKAEAQDTRPFVVIITDGLALPLAKSSPSNLIQAVINNRARIPIPCLNRHQEFIIKLILKTFTERYNIKCQDCKIIREQDNAMFYYGGLFQCQ